MNLFREHIPWWVCLVVGVVGVVGFVEFVECPEDGGPEDGGEY